MSNHLLLIALGPIQEFIASARRSRDLWYGSWLLSDLSKTAARTLAERCGVDALIFPKPVQPADLAPDSRLGVANKIVAIVPGSQKEVADLAAAVETAVVARLGDLAAGVFDKVGDDNLDDRATAARQVQDLPEFYWVAQPLTEGEGDYARVRRYLEALLAARKGTRNFRQLAGRSGHPKSSLDGMRESVIPRERYPERRADDGAAWSAKAWQLYRSYGAGPAEQLSGVDLLKRQGSAGRHFPSTSHIAALPYLKRLDPHRVQAAMPAFVAALAKYGVEPETVAYARRSPALGVYDASLLYAARLTENLAAESEKQAVVRDLERFLQAIGGAARPQPYYALLRADGDRMGATIDALVRPAAHAEISTALNRFAGRVEGIVAEHEGAAVYSGGDDVLAFVPLHTVLACAKALADAFAEELQQFGAADRPAPSLSTGIAITHHVEPLADALQLAHSAEQKAKQVDGKNALAIIISKRSGGDRSVAGPRQALAHRLGQMIDLERSGAIPDGAAYQIEDMLVRLDRPGGARLGPALRFEAKRILQHKPRLRLPNDRARSAQELLRELAADEQLPLGELVHELITAKFLAGAMQLAEGE